MTCIEKLRELHPEWDEEHILRKIKYSCPSDFDIANDMEICGACYECWEREADREIPHEFEYISRCRIEDADGVLEEHIEHIWVTVLDRMYKHHYTGKPYFRIRTEAESGDVWEGWVTEKEIREMLEERVK